jgi:biotin-(acetyl-CoA carboxylase) ligase
VLAQTAGSAVVVGVGLNLWQSTPDFPPELRQTATSIALAIGGGMASPGSAGETVPSRRGSDGLTVYNEGGYVVSGAAPGRPAGDPRVRFAVPGDLEARRNGIAHLADLFNQRLTAAYAAFQNGGPGFARDALRNRFYLLNAEVVIRDRGVQVLDAAHGTVEVRGKAVDIGPLGELILETETGKEMIRSGHVDSCRWPE